MLVTLTIIRYPKKNIAFAVAAMALHRLPLLLNRKISFFKLMGCGKNGTFDKHPDWQQWAILTVQPSSSANEITHPSSAIKKLYGAFINKWLNFFNCETWTIFLQPIEGHGKWDSKEPFGNIAKKSDYSGIVATLTRATIRLKKLKSFWQNVASVAHEMAGANGFITSVGIGEIPYIKQATFSIWQNKAAMQEFAYQLQDHKEVIKKTRKENWYSEDMFVRFKPLKTFGTLNGNDPLKGML